MPILKFYDKQSSSWKVVGGGQSKQSKDFITQEQADSIYAKVTQIANLATSSEVENVKREYLKQEDANANFANKSHTHSTNDISGLDTKLNGKANFSHFHSMSDILGLERALQNFTVPRDVVRRAELNSYAQIATLGPLLQNIGKVQDQSTGQFLSIQVVDKGQVPRNTSGMIVFERA